MKLYNIKYIGFLALLVGFSFLSSCEEEEMTGSNAVELLSFGPSGVAHGDTIVFIGNRLDEVTSLVFAPGIEVTSDAFVTQESSQFTVAVPTAAEAGYILLKTADGDSIKSKSILNFDVPVEVTDVTTEARPGGTVTITGDNINWIETVKFTEELIVLQEDFVSQSATELVVNVPMEAETGFLIFTSGGTDPLSFGTEEKLIVTLPAVTALNPKAIKHTDDLTIEGTDLDLVTEVVLMEGVSVLKADFKSQSATALVVAVPANVVAGTVLLKQLSPINVVSSMELTIILPIGEGVTPSPAVPGTDDITITGTDLDLVAELILPTSGTVLAADFKSHSATEIVLAVPASATQGVISYKTIHGYENLLGVTLKLPSEGDADVLDYYIYQDAMQNGWEEWGGWGHDLKDFANQEEVHTGDYAIKVIYNDQWGALQFGSPSTDVLNGYKYMSFKVYASAAQDLIFQIGDNSDSYFSIPQGWSSVDLLIEDIAGNDNVGEIRIKNNNPSLPTTLFIDEIGLRLGDPPPPPLDYVIYDDALQNGWEEWGGWGHDLKDFANQEEVQSGDNAIKVIYNDQWGALQFGSPSTDVLSGYSKISFYVHASAAQDLIFQIGDNADTYLSIPSGWSRVELNISDVAGNDNVGEIRIKNNNPTLPTTLFIDEIGLYL
ncbi:MAG: hypothetical protein OCD76_04625 [Reichenbachiella sp.]